MTSTKSIISLEALKEGQNAISVNSWHVFPRTPDWYFNFESHRPMTQFNRRHRASYSGIRSRDSPLIACQFRHLSQSGARLLHLRVEIHNPPVSPAKWQSSAGLGAGGRHSRGHTLCSLDVFVFWLVRWWMPWWKTVLVYTIRGYLDVTWHAPLNPYPTHIPHTESPSTGSVGSCTGRRL